MINKYSNEIKLCRSLGDRLPIYFSCNKLLLFGLFCSLQANYDNVLKLLMDIHIYVFKTIDFLSLDPEAQMDYLRFYGISVQYG